MPVRLRVGIGRDEGPIAALLMEPCRQDRMNGSIGHRHRTGYADLRTPSSGPDGHDRLGRHMPKQRLGHSLRLIPAEAMPQEEPSLRATIRVGGIQEVVDDLRLGDEDVSERGRDTNQKSGSVVTRNCDGSTVTRAAKGRVNSTS